MESPKILITAVCDTTGFDYSSNSENKADFFRLRSRTYLPGNLLHWLSETKTRATPPVQGSVSVSGRAVIYTHRLHLCDSLLFWCVQFPRSDKIRQTGFGMFEKEHWKCKSSDSHVPPFSKPRSLTHRTDKLCVIEVDFIEMPCNSFDIGAHPYEKDCSITAIRVSIIAVCCK